MDRVAEIEVGLRGTSMDDPVHVWWSGARWIVVEGHHRHEAYRQREARTGARPKVPVVAHVGMALSEAMGAAARLNDRSKEKITKAEKQNRAWVLVVMGEGSIATQAAASGASKSQISNMRVVREKLVARRMADAQMMDATWQQCREWANGKTQRDFSEGAQEARAREVAEWLRGCPVVHPLKSPDVIARALEILSPAFTGHLLECDGFWDALNTTGRALLEERDAADEQQKRMMPQGDIEDDF